MKLSVAEQIWNRAAIGRGGSHPRDGDIALRSILLFHSLVMNGGLGHGCTAVDGADFGAAVEGFRFFGLNNVADFLESVADLPEEEIETLDAEYNRLVPDDPALVAEFDNRFRITPEVFAPLDYS